MMSHAAAGEVLYNWRVFPLHLDEPPVAALQQRQAYEASLDPAETRQLRGDSQSGAAQPGPAVGSSDGLQQVQAEAEGTSRQRQVQAGAKAGKDACIAWPENGGLRKGPVVYRYAACSCTSEILVDCVCSCASSGSAAAALGLIWINILHARRLGTAFAAIAQSWLCQAQMDAAQR